MENVSNNSSGTPPQCALMVPSVNQAPDPNSPAVVYLQGPEPSVQYNQPQVMQHMHPSQGHYVHYAQPYPQQQQQQQQPIVYVIAPDAPNPSGHQGAQVVHVSPQLTPPSYSIVPQQQHHQQHHQTFAQNVYFAPPQPLYQQAPHHMQSQPPQPQPISFAVPTAPREKQPCPHQWKCADATTTHSDVYTHPTGWRPRCMAGLKCKNTYPNHVEAFSHPAKWPGEKPSPK